MRNCRYGISKKLWISDKRLCSNLRRIEFSDPDYQYYIGRLLIFSSIVVNPYFTFLSCFQLFDTLLLTTSGWFLLMNGLFRKKDLSYCCTWYQMKPCVCFFAQNSVIVASLNEIISLDFLRLSRIITIMATGTIERYLLDH